MIKKSFLTSRLLLLNMLLCIVFLIQSVGKQIGFFKYVITIIVVLFQ